MNNLSAACLEPYIGLKPFTEQEKDRFFGRDRETSILLDKIRANRLTLLLAASGVGKSSLLQAGIMPAFRADGHAELIYHNSWAAEPGAALRESILNHYAKRPGLSGFGGDFTQLSLKDTLLACTLFGSGQQILLLDQFEEFFNYQRFQKGFKTFVEELSAAVLDRSLPACFVFSMREDFALELNAFKPFLPGVFDSYFRLEKLTRDQARLAIEQPLQQIGWSFAPKQDSKEGLLEQVLDDLAKREQERQFGVQELLALQELPLLVEPPHLQIVCRELWDNHRDEAVKQITHAAYHKAGRAEGILETYFLRKICQFSKKEQVLASASFDHLVGQRATKVAHPLERLAELTRADANALKLMLDKLQDCAVLRRQKRGEEFWYELYHDIFSESIDKWNREFKHRQRKKRLAVGTAAVLIAGGLLFAGNNWRANYYGRYLQLSPKESISDRIEVYQGTEKSLDLFQIRNFGYETLFLRQELEADKRFGTSLIYEKSEMQADIVSDMPMVERIPFYMATGLYGKGRELADSILRENKAENIQFLPKHFAQVRTKASVTLLSSLFEKQKLRGAVITAFVQLKSKSSVPDMIEILTDSGYGKMNRSVLVRLMLELAVPEIVKLLEDRDKDESVRSAAVSALGELKADSAVPEIVKLLTDSESNVRSAAASTLGELKAKAAAQDIVRLLRDSDINVRNAAVKALGKLKAKAAAQDIVRLLTDSDEYVRISAVSALSELKADSAVPEIVKLLTDSNEYVRSVAVEALGKLKAKAAAQDIVRLLTDSDPNVRSAAAKAIGKLKVDSAVPDIVKLLTDSNEYVRSTAVEALGKLKAKAAAQDIVRLLTDRNRNVQEEAAKAIGKLKVEAVTTEIVKLLADSDPDVRSTAVAALRKLKAESAVITEIINLLRNSNADVRSTAFYALGELKADSAVPEIVKLLTDSDSDVRHKAVFALGKMKAEAAVPEIVKLLTDSSSDVRRAAVKALGELKADTAVSEIARLLEDSNEEVRGRAIEALGKLKADSAAPEIIKLWAGSDSNVRIPAVEAFGKLKADSAVPDIVKLLVDSDYNDKYVWSGAVEALGELKADSAVPEIVKLLTDSGWDVRRAAVKALGELKAETAVPEIVRLLTDSDSDDVRLQAALALARMNDSSPQLQAWREQAFKEAEEKIADDEKKEAAELLAPVFTAQAATLLAQLMDDADQNVAQEAVKAIGFAAEFHPEWIPKDKLLALLKHPEIDMRETAVTSLGQLIAFRGEKKAANFPELDQRVRNVLSSLIKDTQQKTSIRATAIDAFGDTGREECAQFLFELLPAFDRSKEESLHSRCIFWLGRMNHAPARDYVEDELRKLEQAKAEWREQRDQNSGSIADKDDAWWQVREYRLGSALARIASAERGIELLGHPLHYVRQAAVRALAGKADADLIGKIIHAHQNFDPDDLPSPFPYTAFQAIDLALWNLEYTGTAADLAKLKTILSTVPEKSNIPGQDGAIKERLEWTIERLQSKTAERK